MAKDVVAERLAELISQDFEVGMRILQMRLMLESRGISFAAIGAKAGYSRSYVYRVLSGESGGRETILRVCDNLDSAVDEMEKA